MMDITHLSNLVNVWEQHAQSHPDDWCVHDAVLGKSYTWRDLALLVQHHRQSLDKLGLLPQSRVALLGAPSVHWIAAIWACWSSNMAWCPLPPPHSPERLKEQLRHGDFAAQWDGADWALLNELSPPCPELTAYLIYTSGSTGTPKAVMVSPHALPDVWQSQQMMFHVDRSSVCSWMLSAAFDASISDVGVALHAGASLVIAPLPRFKRYEQWMAMMETYKVTHIDAPPSWLNLWHSKAPPPSLKVVVAGGEPTPPTIVEAWGHQCRWVNVYGPTEATICTSMEHRFAPYSLLHTIGQPMAHVVYEIIDPSTLKQSHQGELWIGGSAVAHGYWNAPELTQEKFVWRDGRKWFRSGDWVRFHEGMFIFEGRIDRQIKKNGQLINLDEVEQVINACADVRQAVVVSDRTGKITAYYDSDLQVDGLRQWSAERLPAWGLPQRWQRLTEFPQTANGKVNRKILEGQ